MLNTLANSEKNNVEVQKRKSIKDNKNIIKEAEDKEELTGLATK